MVIIDPAHGGKDIGNGTNIYFNEKDKVLQISLYQYQRLNELNIKTTILRTDDSFINKDDRLKTINNFKDSLLLISNHIDHNDINYNKYIIYNSNCDKKLFNLFNKYNINNKLVKLNNHNKDFYSLFNTNNIKNKLIVFYGNAKDQNSSLELIENWVNLAEEMIKLICEYFNKPYYLPKAQYYIIKYNDTTVSILNKFKISIDSLIKANPTFNGLIYPGGLLIIK